MKRATPWLLSARAVPVRHLAGRALLLTALLSLQVFDYASGVKPGEYTLAQFAHLVGDSYYLGIFWRTFWIAGLTTLICMLVGAPEAYVLSRMGSPGAPSCCWWCWRRC
jgi:putative spermidine/putrescine transport system permease protein